MILDLLSTDNYAMYNVKLAQLLGLHSAVYLSELMNINDKAIKKSKLDGKYFKLNRTYITERTTFSVAEQRRIEQQFKDIGLLKCDEKNSSKMTLDITVLTSILAGDETIVQDLKKLVKTVSNRAAAPRMTKLQQNIDLCKTYIKTTNDELREAYCDWIDAVFAKLGWMSKKAVTVGEELVDETSNHNLDIALKIVEIATVNGYKDMTWAVRMYNDNYKPKYQFTNTVPERSAGLGDEVF